MQEQKDFQIQTQMTCERYSLVQGKSYTQASEILDHYFLTSLQQLHGEDTHIGFISMEDYWCKNQQNC